MAEVAMKVPARLLGKLDHSDELRAEFMVLADEMFDGRILPRLGRIVAVLDVVVSEDDPAVSGRAARRLVPGELSPVVPVTVRVLVFSPVVNEIVVARLATVSAEGVWATTLMRGSIELRRRIAPMTVFERDDRGPDDAFRIFIPAAALRRAGVVEHSTHEWVREVRGGELVGFRAEDPIRCRVTEVAYAIDRARTAQCSHAVWTMTVVCCIDGSAGQLGPAKWHDTTADLDPRHAAAWAEDDRRLDADRRHFASYVKSSRVLPPPPPTRSVDIATTKRPSAAVLPSTRNAKRTRRVKVDAETQGILADISLAKTTSRGKGL